MPETVPFEKMHEDASHWVNEVAEAMGDPRRRVAYHAVRGVFFALRDRLPVHHCFGLSAQLPTLLRGVFFEGYDPEGKPEKFGRDEFLARVRAELESVGETDSLRATEAVMIVLRRHVSEGEANKLAEVLPHGLHSLLQ